jgi:succinate dehydrogenase/fumarate reductase cytochrome b subunit
MTSCDMATVIVAMLICFVCLAILMWAFTMHILNAIRENRHD